MRKYHLLGIVICLVTLAVYAQSRYFEFVDFDDIGYVVANPRVLDGLTKEGVSWAFSDFRQANWHPLTWLSLMVDAMMYRTHAPPGRPSVDPGGFHLTNVLLHVACVWILFQALWRMSDQPWPSALTAGLFALHPLHVESVAWIAERKDVLSSVFGFSAIWFYGEFSRTRRTRWQIFAVLLFFLSLLSKQMFVTLPFLLILLDYWPLGHLVLTNVAPGEFRKSLSRSFVDKAPYFLLAFLFCVVIVFAQRAGGAVRAIEKYPLVTRVSNAVVAYVDYLFQMFWPTRLCFYYPHPGSNIPIEKVLVSSMLLIGVTAATLWWGKRAKYLPVGWFWYLGTLVPVIGLVQIGDQARADRYTYLPLVGPFMMFAWGLDALFHRLLSTKKQREVAYATTSTLVLCVLLVLTYRQVGTWRDSETLFRHAIDVHPDNHMAYSKLGEVHFQRRQFAEAVDDYRSAIESKPDFAVAYGNLMVVLTQVGRSAEAVRAYRQAPHSVREDAALANNIAWIMATSPDPAARNGPMAVDRALYACSKTEFQVAGYLDSLAAAYAEVGNFDEAIKVIDRALALAQRDGSTFFIGELTQRKARFLVREPWRDLSATPTP
ncbi:MAG: tetratricopeptide repeat protein [Planctomycetota bacterium]